MEESLHQKMKHGGETKSSENDSFEDVPHGYIVKVFWLITMCKQAQLLISNFSTGSRHTLPVIAVLLPMKVAEVSLVHGVDNITH